MTVGPAYTLLERIHDGPGAAIHRGRRTKDGVGVVLKLLKSDIPAPADIERLASEHELLRRLDLPGVPRPLGLETHDGRLALVLSAPPGRPLGDVLRAQRLGLEMALRIGFALAQVLAALHRHGVVHGDLRPGTTIVDLEPCTVTLIDFGVSAGLARRGEGTRAEPPPSELAYASPERTGRMNRRADHRSDLYSLGVVLYEMLTGAPPFVSRDPIEIVHGHVARPPAPVHERAPEVPHLVSDIVARLLEKAAEDRYQTASGLAADLTECLVRLRRDGRIDAFPLGQQDRAAVPHMPSRLHGRDAELSTLAEATTRAGRGGVELVLLAGPSGVGKSSLADALGADVARKGGYFAAGKCDQIHQSAPFAPFTQACRALVRRALAEPPDALADLAARLGHALGPNGRVVADLVPELERILGRQPPVPELGPTEAQNRFHLAFQRFLCAFCARERPLALFLDDLQWADPASLKLLSALLTDPETSHLVVLGAYRDNEVDDGHPLTRALAELRERGGRTTIVSLAPLDARAVAGLLADALGAEPAAVAELSALLHERTGGNPFFLNQLLQALGREGLLAWGDRRGAWDLDAIRAATGDDVGALLSSELDALAPEVRHALALAACVGHRVDLGTLALLLDRRAEDVATMLREAQRVRLLVPVTDDGDASPVTFRFLHDRVQQACYALLAEAPRRAAHLRIGRRLRAELSDDPHDEALFAVAHHLRLGAALLTEPGERADASQVLCAAGLRARARAAYEAAADFLETSAALLDEASFARDHRATFDLHAAWAECAYLSGRAEEAEALCEKLLTHAQSWPERARVTRQRIHLRTNLGHFADAVGIAREALATRGIELPVTEEACSATLSRKLDEVHALLVDRRIEDLVDAPDLADPDLEATLELLTSAAVAGYYVSPLIHAIGSLEQVSISLRHGHSPLSSGAYASYGFLLAALCGRYEEAGAFGALAVELSRRRPAPLLAPQVQDIYGTFGHFCTPVRIALDHLEEAFRLGDELGEFIFASYAADNSVVYRLALGASLPALREDIDRYLAFVQRARDALSVAHLAVSKQIVDNLEGRTRGRRTLNGDGFEEEGFPEEQERAGRSPVAFWFHVARLMILFLRGDHAGALEAALLAEPRAPSAAGQYNTTELSFFTCLAAAARAGEAEPAEAARCREILDRHATKIAAWAATCPANYRHKRLLVSAEIARLEGRHDEAMDAYEGAIEAARAEGFLRDEAIAAERYARFHLARRRPRVARMYLADAHAGYVRWGATDKAAELAAEHEAVLLPDAGGSVTATGRAGSPGTNAGADAAVDAAALVRAAQTLVSEVDLARVLEHLLRIAAESAGARRGVLLLDRDGQLSIEARLDGARVEVGPSTPLARATDLPVNVLRYVARTGEPVVLGDAAREHRFAADPYLAREKPRSILCLAMTQNERLTGVLYLEHGAVTDAFSPARVELSGLLASLSATAVENARLYARVEETTRALRAANESLESEVTRRTEQLSATNALLSRELVTREEAERTRAGLQEEMIRMQEARLVELSAPVLPITDSVVVIPLIGAMDARRGAQVLDAALEGARAHAAQVVILDVTGTKLVDAEVAGMLSRTADALRLLGVRTLVTGMSPAMARALVTRGEGLGAMTTMATLRAAVAHALRGAGSRKERGG
jgi:predicted ATPase/GAF domain-containing protein/anti-anti-sigma regulatory factor